MLRHKLDLRVFAVFLLVVMPFAALGAFVVLSMARGALRQQVGESLEQRAFQASVALEQHLGDMFVGLRLLGGEPTFQPAPAKAVTAEEARQLEAEWAQGSQGLDARLLGSPAATRLRELTRVRPAVRLAQWVDAHGRLLASSSRGGRVLYGEMPWFRALRDQQGEQPWLSDVYLPPGGKLPVYDVAWPQVSPEGVFGGALRLVVDAADLYGVLAPVRIGRTGHAELLRLSDGLVLASDDSSRVLRRTVPGFQALRAALAERRGYWLVPAVESREAQALEPARLVGLSPPRQLPHAEWLVSVEQDQAEALAPVAGITRYLMLHFVGALATALLLGLYFALKLERPVIEERIHLHEEHLPKSAQATAP